MQHDTSPHVVSIDGKKRHVQCASLVLCYSQRVFAQVYPRFNRFYAKAFLTEALRWFGGAARRCVVDNTNVIIAHGTGSNAVPAPEMKAFGQRFGFEWMAHTLGDKNRSARVERPFHYIENNFYPGRTFADLTDLNTQLRAWCTQVDNKPKRRTRTTPLARFACEQPALQPLPIHIPEVYDSVRRTVDLEGYIHYQSNRYSVPDALIGKEVEIRASLATIRVFNRHNVVVEHGRVDDGQHRAVTAPEHRRKRRVPTDGNPRIPEEGPLRAAAPEFGALVDAWKKRHGGRAVRPIRRLHSMFLEYPIEHLVAGIRQSLEYNLLDLDRIENIVLQRIAHDLFRTPASEVNHG
jgi:hypothetical protein